MVFCFRESATGKQFLIYYIHAGAEAPGEQEGKDQGQDHKQCNVLVQTEMCQDQHRQPLKDIEGKHILPQPLQNWIPYVDFHGQYHDQQTEQAAYNTPRIYPYQIMHSWVSAEKENKYRRPKNGFMQ